MREKDNELNRDGFTIVELLIMVVVIAILAAITIVAYNGITKQAVETSMQSDLKNSSTALEVDWISSGSYPADAASANNGQGLKSSGDNSLTYVQKPYGYCVAVTNPRSSKTLALKSLTGQTGEGNCDIIVSTFAGSGTAGSVEGTGTAAQFNNPAGIAFDASGSLYVADRQNNRIRKISPGGEVSTFAGSTQGDADGTGTGAQFYRPSAIDVDASGSVYVADMLNHRIRKISSSGVVTTLAGSTQGFADGTGSAAQFDAPAGVALDDAGNVYVGDQYNCRVRKITSAGDVTTLAGSGSCGVADGTGAAARFFAPGGITAGSDGMIYVADSDAYNIRKISAGGVVTTLAGSSYGYLDGTGTGAQFAYPYGVDVDSTGSVFVADYVDNRIRRISPGGVVTTLAGTGAYGYVDGLHTAAQFRRPYDIAIDTSGLVYVADYSNHVIRRITQ